MSTQPILCIDNLDLFRPVHVTSTFKHTPLRLDKKELRLLTIKASSSRSIELTLRDADLNSAYVCLSYEWRESTPLQSLSINGESFEVRPNLYQFLLAMKTRLDHGLVVPDLWIDAICIDQNMVEERDHQVKMMAEIYSGADAVLIWPGQLPSLAHQNSKPSQKSIQVWVESLLIPDWTRTMYELRASTYWQRTWIIQEIFLAVDCSVMLGVELVNFPKVAEEACATVLSGEPSSPLRNLLATYEARGTPLDFDETMIISYNSICQDPRDKIYAMLGVCAELKDLAVSYRCSMKDLLIKTLMHVRPQTHSQLGEVLYHLASVCDLVAVGTCPGRLSTTIYSDMLELCKKKMLNFESRRTQLILYDFETIHESLHTRLTPGIRRLTDGSRPCRSQRWLLDNPLNVDANFAIDWDKSFTFLGRLAICFRETRVLSTGRKRPNSGPCHNLWHSDGPGN